MAHPISVRFRDQRVVERLHAEAAARGTSTSALAEELIEEGLRARHHPQIRFRDGAGGRRAHLVGGPDIWEVVDGIVGGDVPAERRVDRAEEVFGLARAQVDAALTYYAEFTDEIDGLIEANRRAADDLEARWRHRQDLLAR